MEEEFRKICPFRIDNTPPISNDRCIRSSCAWWCEFAQECAVPLLAGMIADGDLCRTAFDGSRKSEAVSRCRTG